MRSKILASLSITITGLFALTASAADSSINCGISINNCVIAKRVYMARVDPLPSGSPRLLFHVEEVSLDKHKFPCERNSKLEESGHVAIELSTLTDEWNARLLFAAISGQTPVKIEYTKECVFEHIPRVISVLANTEF